MSDTKNKSLRTELFKEHPSTSGPFQVAPSWLKFFGIMSPYIVVLIALAYLPDWFAITILLPSVFRPLVSAYLGGSLLESLFQIKVIDKKTLNKPTIAKFYLRELFLILSFLLSGVLLMALVLIFSMFKFDYSLKVAGQGLPVWIFGFPFFFVLFDHQKQTLYDKLAGLVVISSSPYFNVQYPVTILPVEENKYSGLLPFKLPF